MRRLIRFGDRKYWRRLTEMDELFWRLRLRHTRLAADLAAVPRCRPPEVKELMTQLLDQAGISARLEAASVRLETYKDLYEGATDRIAERHWFIVSTWLEIGIVALLLIEIVLLLAELYSVYIK